MPKSSHPPEIWPYQTLGSQQHPPLVLLHGFMGRGLDWLRVAEGLAGHFFCIMPDLPGHGRNLELSLGQPLDFPTVVSGLATLLDHLALAEINLAGYSMGGRIALYAATTFPERIRALVLEGTNPGLSDPQARQERAQADARQAESLLAQGVERFIEQWYELELFSTLKRQPGLLEAVKARRQANEAPWLAKVIRELSPGRQPPLWEKLAGLSMPVLLIAGGLDTKYTQLAAQMAEKIAQAEVVLIPEAGHNSHLEQPELFIRQLQTFLAKP